MKPTYLGDGLFASYDDWQIRLYCDRFGVTHEVFLEPEVLESFVQYLVTLGLLVKP